MAINGLLQSCKSLWLPLVLIGYHMPGQQMKWIGPRYRETIETLWINYSVHAVLQHLYSPHISVGSSTKYMNSTEVCDCVLGHRPPCGVNYIEGRGWLLKNTCIHHHFHLLSYSSITILSMTKLHHQTLLSFPPYSREWERTIRKREFTIIISFHHNCT